MGMLKSLFWQGVKSVILWPLQKMYFNRNIIYLEEMTVPVLALLQQKSISSHFQFQPLNNFSTDIRNTHKHKPIDKRFPFLLASHGALELMHLCPWVYRLKVEKYFTRSKFAVIKLIYGRRICQICWKYCMSSDNDNFSPRKRWQIKDDDNRLQIYLKKKNH